RLLKDGQDTNALAPSDIMRAQTGQRVEFDNVIFSDELTALRHELAGRKVLFVVDACHSGKVARNVGDDEAEDSAEPGLRAKTLRGRAGGRRPGGRARSAWRSVTPPGRRESTS